MRTSRVLYADCFGHPPGKPLPNEDIARAAGILRDTLRVLGDRKDGKGARAGRPPPPRRPPPGLPREPQPGPRTHHRHLQRPGDRPCGNQQEVGGNMGRRPPASPLGRRVRDGPHDTGPVVDQRSILPSSTIPRSPSGSTARCTSPASTPARKGRSRSSLPRDTKTETAATIMDRLAACSADGRIPGYPYPLFDAHRTVALTEEIVEQVKGDLLGRLAAAGIDRQTYEILFGDYHDEFARY